jgi:hypothetical protein
MKTNKSSKNSARRNQRRVDPASRSNHFIPIRSKPIARISSSQELRQIVKREPPKKWKEKFVVDIGVVEDSVMETSDLRSNTVWDARLLRHRNLGPPCDPWWRGGAGTLGYAHDGYGHATQALCLLPACNGHNKSVWAACTSEGLGCSSVLM